MNSIKYTLTNTIFAIIITSHILVGCGKKNSHKDIALSDKLTKIEENMLQDSENLDSLLSHLDTKYLTPIAKARISTIRGLAQFNRGEFRNCISNLEKAEITFIDKGDAYHLNINKLIRAFAFEYLQLETNAANLYVECDTYFSDHKLERFRFYSSLGLLRQNKYLNINQEDLEKRILRDVQLFESPIYYGLYYSALGKVEKADSLSILYFEKAIDAFTRAEYWSRVFSMELNNLYLKIEQDHSKNMQEIYNQFLPKKYPCFPSPEQKLRYLYAQAYLYAKQNKDEDAIKVASEVLEEAIRLDIPRVQSDCIEILAFLYKQNGSYKTALSLAEEFHAMESHRIDDLTRTQLLALGAHYKYSELEKDKLNLHLRVQRSILIIVAIGFIVFILVVAGVRLLQSNKRKREKLQLEKMAIQGQIENILSSFQESEIRNEGLINQMEDIKDRYSKSIRISEFLHSIENQEIKSWMEFEVHFAILLPGWIDKLKQKAPRLTSTDVKYCMCIYFNLNNYTISNLCNVSNDAIKSAKKRIRDKLSLNDATEIYLFLKKIE